MLIDSGATIQCSANAKKKTSVKQVVFEGNITKEITTEQEVVCLELSALVSYDGENLELVKGKTLKLTGPTYIATLEDIKKLIA